MVLTRKEQLETWSQEKACRKEGSSRLRTMEEGAVSRLGFEDFKGWGRCSRTRSEERRVGKECRL